MPYWCAVVYTRMALVRLVNPWRLERFSRRQQALPPGVAAHLVPRNGDKSFPVAMIRKAIPRGSIRRNNQTKRRQALVAERIVRLAKLVGPENVIASTDCGFAQGPFTQRVHESIMWAKLEALVAGARLAEKQV